MKSWKEQALVAVVCMLTAGAVVMAGGLDTGTGLKGGSTTFPTLTVTGATVHNGTTQLNGNTTVASGLSFSFVTGSALAMQSGNNNVNMDWTTCTMTAGTTCTHSVIGSQAGGAGSHCICSSIAGVGGGVTSCAIASTTATCTATTANSNTFVIQIM